MKCEELTELLPDYLQNSLPASSRTTVDDHLRTCADCSAHVEVWTRLGALPDEAPSPQLRMRFEAMLGAYEEGRARRAAWPIALSFRPALAYAAALSILVLGFVAGRYAQPDRGTPEIASLRTELSSTNDRIAALNQLVVLSMLQQQSASARLQGVDYSLQVRHPNPEIVGALLRSLRSDPSVDVRLAALDSLRRYGDDPGVRRGLMDSLPRKQSPLVQIALIDAMVELRDTEAVPHIRQLKDTPDVSPVVRDRARWGLVQLARG